LDSVHVWGIGIDTDGVSYENPNFSVPWATTVGTVTNSSATVKTLVYEVRNSLGQWIGWHPTSPENVEIGYTVWGFKPDPIVNLTGPTSMYDDETKQWGASIYDGSSPFSHKWYRKDFGSANFSQVGSSSSYSYGTPDTSFYLCVQITDNASRSDADTITVTVSHRPLSVEIDGYHLPYAYYDWENTWWGEVSGGYPPYNTYAWSMRVFDDVEEEWTEWESVCSDSIYDIERDDWEDLEELFDYEFEIGSDIQLKVVVTDNAQATDEDIIDLEVTEAQKMSAKPLPKGFKLEQNYPNPFNPVTTISFQLPKSSNVTLVIYNIQGREVARLVDGYVGAGYHSITWDASTAASGIYIYRLQSRLAGGFSDTKRMLLIK